MYLLNPSLTVIEKSNARLFTFHYVSIKSVINLHICRNFRYLHSTMYLLNLYLFSRMGCKYQNLHSTMYLLNLADAINILVHVLNLHSTMYLLNRRQYVPRYSSLYHLHSTMYLLNLHPCQGCRRVYSIYIPLCIY